ncbi:hypothetical protein LguiA_018589 [Lonicera macranthoides]
MNMCRLPSGETLQVGLWHLVASKIRTAPHINAAAVNGILPAPSTQVVNLLLHPILQPKSVEFFVPCTSSPSQITNICSFLVLLPPKSTSPTSMLLLEIIGKMMTYIGHFINDYFIKYGIDDDDDNQQQTTNSTTPPLLLVHGFGASIAHWRRNFVALAQNHTVYAIDLLGFGASDKPVGFEYTMEVWAQLILDFLEEIVQRPTILIGNSVGSLACVIATADSTQSLVRGLVLLNCAGGMNNKAIVDDWRIKLLFPLLWLVDFLLKQRWVASFIFERVKQRENLRNILLSVYGNKESVDDELVQIIKEPADGEGALDAFVSIVTGPPGPNPVQLMPRITVPVLVLWGDEDPFTPLNGPVGKYFSFLPSELPNISLGVLEGVGHCPHDDRPESVHEKLLPWLANLPAL